MDSSTVMTKPEKGFFVPKLEDMMVGYECVLCFNGERKSFIVDENQFQYIDLILGGYSAGVQVPYINEEFIKSLGFNFVKEVNLSNTWSPKLAYVFKLVDDPSIEAKKNGGWMIDHFVDTYTLYAIDGSMFGIKPYSEIVIERQRTGGFAGVNQGSSVVRGEIDDPNVLKFILKQLKIKINDAAIVPRPVLYS